MLSVEQLAEAVRGKRVLVALRRGTDLERVFMACAEATHTSASSIRRARGRERITFPSGGELVFRCTRYDGGRGYTVVVTDEPNNRDLEPCVATGGQIVRAV